MAIKKIQIKPPDGDYADVLHPETDSTQVLMDGQGTTLGTAMGLKADSSALDAHLADIANYNFGNRPYNSKANLTLYVDQANGNDNNNGTSAGTAFKTFEKAFSLVPIFITHKVVIRIVGNYTGDILASNVFSYGNPFQIIGHTENKDNHTITGYIRLQNIRSMEISYGLNQVLHHLTINANYFFAVLVEDSLVNIVDCKMTNQHTSGQGIRAVASNVVANSCSFINISLAAINAIHNSHVMSYNNTGSATKYGLHSSYNSAIGKYGTQPTGNTSNEFTDFAGVIR